MEKHLSGENRRAQSAVSHGLPPDTRRVHFVGVGGVGMSGVAEMMCGLGYEVSGSDLTASAATERLRACGAAVEIGHDAGRVAGADVVVVSAAVPDDNPEIAEARRRHLPVLRRGVMLAGLAAPRSAIAVTGTHGKSTTSSMVAVMLAECGLDPAVVVGARVDAFGSNARIGNGPHFVVEADESEPSLLALRPRIAVLTNLEAGASRPLRHVRPVCRTPSRVSPNHTRRIGRGSWSVRTTPAWPACGIASTGGS